MRWLLVGASSWSTTAYADADGTEHFAEDPTGGDRHRRLADGREFTIVQMAYASRDLETRLADVGWRATVTLLTPAKYVVSAQPM